MRVSKDYNLSSKPVPRKRHTLEYKHHQGFSRFWLCSDGQSVIVNHNLYAFSKTTCSIALL